MTSTLFHFFICVILIGIQAVGVNFRNGEVNVSKSFVMLKMTLKVMKNINEYRMSAMDALYKIK